MTRGKKAGNGREISTMADDRIVICIYINIYMLHDFNTRTGHVLYVVGLRTHIQY